MEIHDVSRSICRGRSDGDAHYIPAQGRAERTSPRADPVHPSTNISMRGRHPQDKHFNSNSRRKTMRSILPEPSWRARSADEYAAANPAASAIRRRSDDQPRWSMLRLIAISNRHADSAGGGRYAAGRRPSPAFALRRSALARLKSSSKESGRGTSGHAFRHDFTGRRV